MRLRAHLPQAHSAHVQEPAEQDRTLFSPGLREIVVASRQRRRHCHGENLLPFLSFYFYIVSCWRADRQTASLAGNVPAYIWTEPSYTRGDADTPNLTVRRRLSNRVMSLLYELPVQAIAMRSWSV